MTGTRVMVLFLWRKMGLYVLTLFLVCLLNFCLIHLMPGDPLVHLLGEEGYSRLDSRNSQSINALRAQLGLDRSKAEQFVNYIQKVVTGDWGWSHHYGQPVVQVIGRHLLWTLILLGPALATSILGGGWLGAWAGWRSRRMVGQWPAYVVLGLYAIPAYCMGLGVLMATSRWHWMPWAGPAGSGIGIWNHSARLALPLSVIILQGAAYKFMIMRNAVREELDAAYVLTALSKGLSDRQVLYGHILRNVLPPFIAVTALNIGFMVGGTLLVEVVFAWRGMGTLIHQAVIARDYPVLSGTLTALATSVLVANAAADVIHALLDPRVGQGVALE